VRRNAYILLKCPHICLQLKKASENEQFTGSNEQWNSAQAVHNKFDKASL